MFQREIRDIQKATNSEVTESMYLLGVNGLGNSRLAALTQIKDFVAAYVSGGVPKATNTITGTVRTNTPNADPVVYLKVEIDNNFYSKPQSDARFLLKTDATTTYLSQANANATYLTQANASASFLSVATPTDVTAQHNLVNGFKVGSTNFIASNVKPSVPANESCIWFKPDDRTTLYSFGSAFVGREGSETHSVRNATGTGGRVIDANYFGLTGGTTYLDKVSVVYDGYTAYTANTSQWEAEVYLITDTNTELSLVRFALVPTAGTWSRATRTLDYVIPSNYRAIGIRNNKIGTAGNINLGMTITLRPYIA